MSDRKYGLTKENLLRIMPPALTHDKSLVSLAGGAAEALAGRPAEIALLALYPRIGQLPEDLLDILAWDFKVDWWDPEYSLEEKRRTLSDSWRVHKMLGTKVAVETAIRAIYPRTDVREWFEYGGRPYHFKLYIDLSGETWSEARPRKVLERVEFYKSLRSHLDEFQFTVRPEEPSTLRLGGTMSATARIPVGQAGDRFDFRHTLRLGGTASAVTTLPIPERRDRFALEAPLRLGGQLAARTAIPIPETP